jgi:hypothetical protein
MNRRESILRTGGLIAGTLTIPTVACLFFQRCTSVKESGTWAPEFIEPAQAELLLSALDTLLPKTDTPSATEAMVHVFIDLYVKECYSSDQQKQFVEGLTALEARAQKDHAATFAELEPAQREQLLATLEKEENSFIKLFKPLALLGYFTSMEGATKAADYNPVPGPFQGCIPVGDMKVSALS